MTNGLQKILTELKAEKPRIDYMLGIVETLLDIQGEEVIDIYDRPIKVQDSSEYLKHKHLDPDFKPIPEEPKDEGAILDAQTKARIDSIKALAEKSTEIA